MPIRIGRMVVLFFVLATGVHAASAAPAQDFQTNAAFDLAVQKSQVLKLGKSRLDTKSAFVTYTNEFFGGRTNALKIQFFHAAN